MNEVYEVLMVSVTSVFIGVLFGSGCASERGRSDIRNEAVQAGVAKWVCDPTTGATEFQWVKPESK